MENNYTDNKVGIFGTAFSMLLNFFAYIDKDVWTFVLGSLVAILTIVYYIIKIYKELKDGD